MTDLTCEGIGRRLEAAARAAAPAIAATYGAGFALGAWVHRTSAALGAIASGRPAAAVSAAVPAPVVPVAEPLAALPVLELRRLAQRRGLRSCGGCRVSKARRADLLAALA